MFRVNIIQRLACVDVHAVKKCYFIIHSDPWSTAFSKSQQKPYYYNSETRASQYDIPLQAISTFG